MTAATAPTLSVRDLRLRNPGYDALIAEAERDARSLKNATGLRGWGTVLLYDGDGTVKQLVAFANLVTRIGDQAIGERCFGIASPPAQVTGMQLGTGTTAVAKTGAGAALVTLVTASLVAIDGGWPQSSLSGSSRRIQFKTTWAAGVATANDISEVVLVNQSTGTQTIAPDTATIARALISPARSKSADDSMAITWNIEILGA